MASSSNCERAKRQLGPSGYVANKETTILTVPPKPEYCLQIQLLFQDGDNGLTWGGDTWWTETEIDKARARLVWHRAGFPVGGMKARLVRYHIDILDM